MPDSEMSLCHICQRPATQRCERCGRVCCLRHWLPWSGFQPLQHFRVCQECWDALTSAQTPRDILTMLERTTAEQSRQQSPKRGETRPMPKNTPAIERTYQYMDEFSVRIIQGLVTISPPYRPYAEVTYRVCYPTGTVWFESQDPSQPGYLVRLPQGAFVREVRSHALGLKLDWGVTPEEKRQVAHAKPVQPR